MAVLVNKVFKLTFKVEKMHQLQQELFLCFSEPVKLLQIQVVGHM